MAEVASDTFDVMGSPSISEFFKRIFSSDFMPHGHCFFWRPEVLWTMVISDTIIAASYYSIPIALIYFVRKRADLTFSWIYMMFAGFIVWCGNTHIMNIWTMWHGTYRLSAVVDAITALFSIVAAAALWPLVPKALSIPSPIQLKAVNTELIEEIERRKEAEKILLSREDTRFKNIVETAPNAIVIVNKEGRVSLINKQAEKLFGYSRDELVGQKLEILVPERYRANHPGYRNGFYKAPQPRPMGMGRDLFGLCKDGREVPIEIGLSPIESQDGKLVVASIIDISERKRAQEALALQAERLVRSNKELEQFAYAASHDLQEPLRMVTSYLQLLSKRYKGRIDTDADEFINYAMEGSTRMQELILGLLEYSRVGRMDTESRTMSLENAFKAALSNLRSAIEESKAAVTHGVLPSLTANDILLTQLFQNLVGNAIKFRGNEIPKVHVDAEQKDGAWLFSVRDNGIGIDPKHRERIFNVFQRLHKRNEYPGSGIGLAICKKVVEHYNGRIWVESDLGRGSVFYFTIPQKEAIQHEE